MSLATLSWLALFLLGNSWHVSCFSMFTPNTAWKGAKPSIYALRSTPEKNSDSERQKTDVTAGDVDISSVQAEAEEALQAAKDFLTQDPSSPSNSLEEFSSEVSQSDDEEDDDDSNIDLILAAGIGGFVVGTAVSDWALSNSDIVATDEVISSSLAVGSVLGGLTYAATRIPSPVAPILQKILGIPIKAVGTVVGTLVQSIAQAIASRIQRKVDDTVTYVQELPNRVVQAAQEKADETAQEIAQIPQRAVAYAEQQVETIVEEVKATPGKIATATKEVIDDVVEEVKATPGKVATATKEAIEDAVERTEQAIEDAVVQTERAITEAVDEAVALPGKKLAELQESVQRLVDPTPPLPRKPTPPKTPPTPEALKSASKAALKQSVASKFKVDIPKLKIPTITESSTKDDTTSKKQATPPLSVPPLDDKGPVLSRLPKVDLPKVEIPKVNLSPPKPPQTPPPLPKEDSSFVFTEVSLKEFVQKTKGSSDSELTRQERAAQQAKEAAATMAKIEQAKQAEAARRRQEQELAAKKAKEAETARREQQLAAQKAKDTEAARREQQLSAQKAKEAEAARRQEQQLAAQKAKEAEAARREQQLAAQKAKEAEAARRQEQQLAAQKAKESEAARRQQQLAAQKAKEAEAARRQQQQLAAKEAEAARRQQQLAAAEERKRAMEQERAAKAEAAAARRRAQDEERARVAEQRKQQQQQRAASSPASNAAASIAQTPKRASFFAPLTKSSSSVKVTAKAPRGVPTLLDWKVRRDGGINGKIYGSPNFKDGEYVETSKIVSDSVENGAVVKTQSGSRYFLSNDDSLKQASRQAALKDLASAKPGATISLTRLERERQARAAQETLEQAKPRATISLFGIFSGDDEEPMPIKSPTTTTTATARKPPRGVPVINKWKQNVDGSVTGMISGSTAFSDNERITTSPIVSGAIQSGSIVRTGSGSKYFLG